MLLMLIETDQAVFKRYFPEDPHPFVSEPFTQLNRGKVDRIVRLTEDVSKPGMGLLAGIREGVILSPFSAPFGGFHFRNENIYAGEVDGFVAALKDYVSAQGLKGLELTLPPGLYHPTFTAKCVSSLLRAGYSAGIPDISSWIDLEQFQGSFSHKNSREYYRQSLRNHLQFEQVEEGERKREVYELIRENRARKGRPIYMAFEDVLQTGTLWPTDFFMVKTPEHVPAAAGIFYRSDPEIVYALFWGDNEEGRPLRAMDFLAFHLWSHYRELGFRYLDLGISTESGIPNDGLLRFKESHNGISSLRYSFTWKNGEVRH